MGLNISKATKLSEDSSQNIWKCGPKVDFEISHIWNLQYLLAKLFDGFHAKTVLLHKTAFRWNYHILRIQCLILKHYATIYLKENHLGNSKCQFSTSDQTGPFWCVESHMNLVYPLLHNLCSLCVGFLSLWHLVYFYY